MLPTRSLSRPWALVGMALLVFANIVTSVLFFFYIFLSAIMFAYPHSSSTRCAGEAGWRCITEALVVGLIMAFGVTIYSVYTKHKGLLWGVFIISAVAVAYALIEFVIPALPGI